MRLQPMLLKILLACVFCATPLGHFSQQSQLYASTEVIKFSDPLLRDRYYQLVEELRCPKCQNQNLADSNAPISKDMKAQIYSMLEAQNSDDEIKAYLVSRYSEFILYRPEVNSGTWFLWFSPLFFVLIGGVIVWRYAFAKPKASLTNTELTVDQQSELEKLLEKDSAQ
jgi:cytochrome c-type biogenesis protein CcmH